MVSRTSLQMRCNVNDNARCGAESELNLCSESLPDVYDAARLVVSEFYGWWVWTWFHLDDVTKFFFNTTRLHNVSSVRTIFFFADFFTLFFSKNERENGKKLTALVAARTHRDTGFFAGNFHVVLLYEPVIAVSFSPGWNWKSRKFESLK